MAALLASHRGAEVSGVDAAAIVAALKPLLPPPPPGSPGRMKSHSRPSVGMTATIGLGASFRWLLASP
jgi:hypothetical protein